MKLVFLMTGLTGFHRAMLREIHDRGHQLLVVTPAAGGFYTNDTDFADLGIDQFAELIYWQSPPKSDELRSIVRRFVPDCVVMVSWNGADAYRAVMRDVPPSTVRLMMMDNLWRGAPRQWLGRLVHRWYIDPVADAVMVPSERTEAYARYLGFAAADVIRGSLSADTNLFMGPVRSGADLHASRSFLYVGRLVRHKGADVLARAYDTYRTETSTPWDLHIVGTGPLARMFEGQPGVRMHGFLQPENVSRLMQNVSALVVPSRVEPYGVVVHEGAIAGLPILCTDFAGAAGALVQDSYNGWTVAAGDDRAWTAALIRMSSLGADRLTAMSTASRTLSDRISPTGWARNLEEEVARRRAAGGGRLAERRKWLSS